MTIRILTNSNEFLSQLKKDLKSKLRPQLKKAAGGLRSELTEKIPLWVKRSTDFYLLNNARNRYELGISSEDLIKAMDDVSQLIVLSMRIQITGNPGGLKVYFDPNILSLVKELPSGKYTSINKKGESHLVEWLDWIVTAGSKIVVEEHHFVGLSGEGRTGGGLMYKGGFWRVPLEIRGDEENNFITRVMDKKIREIYRLMRGHLLGEKARLKYQ